MKMKGRYSALAAAILAARVLADLPPRPNYPGLTLQYEDDFNTFNAAVWTAVDGYVQTQYDLVCYLASNVRVEFGNLVLSTRTESATCTAPTGVPPPAPPTTPKPFSYTSGWVDTFGKLVTTTSGLFEVRARLPQPDFKIWPASWLLSARNNRDRGVCWPVAGEIDVYEVAGGFDAGGGLGGNALCGSAHYGTSCFNDIGAARTLCIPASQLDYANSFHTYAVAWTQTTITWYVDGRVFGEITAQSDPAAFGFAPPGPVGSSSAVRDPFSIVLNTAIAWWVPPQSGQPNIPPGGAQHLIDWVRVWNGP